MKTIDYASIWMAEKILSVKRTLRCFSPTKNQPSDRLLFDVDDVLLCDPYDDGYDGKF